ISKLSLLSIECLNPPKAHSLCSDIEQLLPPIEKKHEVLNLSGFERWTVLTGNRYAFQKAFLLNRLCTPFYESSHGHRHHRGPIRVGPGAQAPRPRIFISTD
uniref:Uncharacterized protein n=1 Tax=Aegilops tauschii subsp. strangulata TaxID=200361 RepID=A0A453JHF6_AEGTS